MEKDFIEIPNQQLADGAKHFHKVLAPSINKKKFYSGEDSGKKAQKAIKIIERLSFALVNDGIDPESGMFMAPQDISDKIQILADSGLGTTSVITQTIITRSIQTMKEPESIFQYFSQTVSYKPGTQMVTPYIGSASKTRMIGIASEYPIISLDQNQETVTSVGKYGVAIEFPEETIRYASYDILRLYISVAIKDMGKFKNIEAVNLAVTKARKLYDNLDETAALLGETTGRGISGAENGTFNLRDLFEAIMAGIRDGVLYDTMLMSTFGYMVFMNDPILRNFISANGGPIFKTPTGSVGKKREISRGANASTGTGGFNNLQFDVPTELLNTNFKIIVTPFMPTYQKGDKIKKDLGFYGSTPTYYMDGGNPVVCGDNMMTDILLIDSSIALLLLEEEKISSDKVENKLIDVTRIKFKERYKFVMLERGRGIGSIRNITIDPDTFDWRNMAKPTVTEAKAALGL